MAAKERTQQAQKKAPPKQAPVDLLSDFDAPSTEKDPPPSYGTNFLQPPLAATVADIPPPAFAHVEPQISFPPPPPIDAVMPPPPPMESSSAYSPSAPPAASAPCFEDLLDTQQHHHHQTHNHSLMDMQAVPPPAAPPSIGIDEDILAALDPAERDALLEEQRKIMEQIEKERSNNDASSATARAMAFDQRSSSAVAKVAGDYDRPNAGRSVAPAARARTTQRSAAGPTVDLGAGEQVPLHGQERTQQAIKDGTAVIVQCIHCSNWMQVTKDATLMLCPTCQVVSPVDSTGAASSADMEAAAQLAADAQLAEELQKEEYKKAEGGSSERPRTATAQRKQKIERGQQVEQSWYDWFTGSTASTTPTKPAAVVVPERGSAEIRRSPGLIAAQTGEERSIGQSRSYDEGEGLLRSGGGGGGARVAESKGMFSCVADSISTAATSMTAYNQGQDDEGNVHGVDSSSLLAMPEVSRQREM
jgi:hypothetical protein